MAAASGLPVLTSRCNGASELFRDGESAWIVNDPADDRETAARIAAWFDPGVRARMAGAARAVAATATHHRCFSRLLEVCANTLRSRRAA
jgi:UDP-glucose:(heptosyl)LPS alpha-1,3-glucosyltransferase